MREKPAFRKHESRQKTYNVNSNRLFLSTNQKLVVTSGFLETHKLFGFSLICIIVSTTAYYIGYIFCKYA